MLCEFLSCCLCERGHCHLFFVYLPSNLLGVFRDLIRNQALEIRAKRNNALFHIYDRVSMGALVTQIVVVLILLPF